VDLYYLFFILFSQVFFSCILFFHFLVLHVQIL